MEVSLNEADRVWLVLGLPRHRQQLAQRAVVEAQSLMKRWFVDLPNSNLAYLVQDTPEFERYVADML